MQTRVETEHRTGQNQNGNGRATQVRTEAQVSRLREIMQAAQGTRNVSTANTGASKSDSDSVKKLPKSAKVKTGDVNHGGIYAALEY